MAIDSFKMYQLIQDIDKDGSTVFYITKNSKRVTLNFHNLFKAGYIFNSFKNR